MNLLVKLKCLLFGHDWKGLKRPPTFLAYKCQRCSKEKEWDFSTKPLGSNPLLKYNPFEIDEEVWIPKRDPEIQAAIDIYEDISEEEKAEYNPWAADVSFHIWDPNDRPSKQ